MDTIFLYNDVSNVTGYQILLNAHHPNKKQKKIPVVYLYDDHIKIISISKILHFYYIIEFIIIYKYIIIYILYTYRLYNIWIMM